MPGADRIGGGRFDGSTALSYGAAKRRRYVALLRVVNVGRTGTLAMSDLIASCTDLS
ncbi:MAG TPA: hypothetical protein VFI58_03040 [Xanthobacteraceae bacterium]|jgi:hypothetical protein|nr:hypothetical protein [Xanthobacteraceae bacterium]